MKRIAAAWMSGIMLAMATHMGVAAAQTAPGKGGLSTVKPIAASVAACSTGLIEIAPVSFDTAGRPAAWVAVQRVKGEVVAAQRVSREEVEQLQRSAACKSDGWRGEQLEG